jgi:uncharacterized protein (DUF2141 family)
MVKKFRFSLLLLFVMGNLAWSTSAKADLKGNLTVEIDGLKNKQGQLCLSVFSSTQGFPSNRDRAFLRQCTKISDTTLTFTFNNLKAGSYAVAAYHDANGDRTLNRNNLGMPVEGFGFSRNPEVSTSAPKFGDAAFLLAGTNTNIQIKLKYL